MVLCVVVAMLANSGVAVAAQYATARLERLAAALERQHPAYDITTRTNSFGEVEHIGLRLFSSQLRETLPSATYDFLERHLLELNISGSLEYDIILAQKPFNFIVGTPETALRIDTTYSYREEKIDYKRYEVTWSAGEECVLRIGFDMDWQLMSGCSLPELEKNFEKCVVRHQLKPVVPLPEKGTYILIPQMNNDIYLEDDSAGYVFSSKQMSRTVSNLMLVEELQEGYTIDITFNRYDYVTDTLSLPLRQFVNYCRAEEGCVPYFAIKSADDENYSGLLLMANPNKGYMHMLTVAFTKSAVDERGGALKGRLIAYIPMHNVKPEYFNLTEYDTIH
jgi:hypothetical protein